MAGGAVWGIDIGQCALKALRCRMHDDGRQVVAEAFDYIEYPKILSQPGSDPAELVGEALAQFLSRNSVLGDRVAVSVSGQSGLARFIKLPPVESKKIPDIVRYEARQQIPFDLNDVVWDYQRMSGGSVEEGFDLAPEVGLFAMKRDAVFRALAPFLKLDIEVDIVQLAPLVLYNFAVFDQMGELPPAEEFDPDNPPESLVIVSMGTDATDLVITNGFRVWQRPIPIGGSHFTKALTRELKLTFAKAEHLKRNATAAADPKAVFQAMRPVFNDLLTELQRSIGYFSNLDRAAKIGRVLALGNAVKLPGLRRYLSQNLGFEIEKIDSFQKLTGPQVLTAPTFQENLLSFSGCYGLVLQGLGQGSVHTNLLPKEIVKDRLIKRKKPWAVAAAAVLLMALSVSYAAFSLALGSVDEAAWKPAENEAKQVVDQASRLQSEADQEKTAFNATDEIGKHLVVNVEGRLRWLELLRAINTSLPSGKEEIKTTKGPDGKEIPPTLAQDISARKELHITNIDCQWMEDVSTWYALVQHQMPASGGAAPPGDPAAPPGNPTAPAPAAPAPTAPAEGPKGPGWIVRLVGYHYHNADRDNQGAQYVRETLIDSLRNGKVDLPVGDRDGTETVSLRDLGVSHPVLVNPERVFEEEIVNPNAEGEAARLTPGGRPGGMGMGMGEMGLGLPGAGRPRTGPAAAADPATNTTIKLQRFNLDVQFCWQPKTPSERHAPKKPPEGSAPASQP